MGGLIKVAIERPVAVLALILLTVLFGVVALRNIPIQMSPDIEKPILEVRVSWPGASPEDVDREVVARLESELSGLNGVDELVSSSRRGRATVTLTYSVSQDMDKALVLLSKLSSVTGLPSDARTPEVALRIRMTARLPGWRLSASQAKLLIWKGLAISSKPRLSNP